VIECFCLWKGFSVCLDRFSKAGERTLKIELITKTKNLEAGNTGVGTVCAHISCFKVEEDIPASLERNQVEEKYGKR